jgi:hypothetical protein
MRSEKCSGRTMVHYSARQRVIGAREGVNDKGRVPKNNKDRAETQSRPCCFCFFSREPFRAEFGLNSSVYKLAMWRKAAIL